MPDFQHDLFISYAHIDNQPLGDRTQGWVTDLHDALRVRLAQLLGETPRIWRDKKLGGADFFDDEIRDALTTAAAMLSILSPRYLRSDYCQLEMREFLAHAEVSGGLRLGNKSRLLKAIKTPVPLAGHPDAIRDVLGFSFFEEEPDGRFHEFDAIYGQEWKRKFWQTVEDLAQELCRLLQLIRAEAHGTPAPASDGLAIYLAQTTYELNSRRESLRRELQQRGYTVLPEQPLPQVGPDLVAQVEADLTRCHFAVHLIGTHYGLVPEADVRSVQEIEHALAAQQSRNHGLPRLIWLAPGTVPDDERQRTFLERLHNDPDAQAGADLLETPITELKTVLFDRLQELQQPADGAASTADKDDDLAHVYLIYDERDEDGVAPLEEYLWNAHTRIEVVRPLFSGDPGAIRTEHEENLRICRAALLYFGQSNEAWLRTKLRDLRKAPGLGRQEPMKATGIYVAPPLDLRKQRFRNREVDMVMQSPNGFEPGALDEFMQRLSLPGADDQGRDDG